MIPSNRDWLEVDGASPEALSALRQALGPGLPDSYLQLLAYSNGGEGPLPVQPLNLCLYSAEDVLSMFERQTRAQFFQGFLMIGSNGGGELIALDTRTGAAWPVVGIDMTNGDLDESVALIAPDFDSFIQLIGLEEIVED